MVRTDRGGDEEGGFGRTEERVQSQIGIEGRAGAASVSLVETQVAQEKGNNEKAQKLTADWIARNMVQ